MAGGCRTGVAVLAGWLLASMAQAAGLTAEEGYLREMPPGQTTTAGFMMLLNGGSQPVAVVAASTPAADRAEIHRHVRDGAGMRMEPVRRLEIPARGRVALQPGGYHLMLIDLRRPLRAGDQVSVTLLDEKGGAHPLRLPVVDMRAQTPATNPHHHH